MTFRTTRRTLLLAGTAAGATIAMPWIAKGAAEFQFKYANNSPVAHPLNIRAVEAMERIKQETNGRVEIQIFPNNQLGSDTDMLSPTAVRRDRVFHPVRADPLDPGAGRFYQRPRLHLGELR